MGIAAGDGDEDGLIDLFVTQFYDQSNTYYRQLATDLFEDATQLAGLRQPSIKVLAFGVQFLDFENDTHLDLFLACGHVDDYRFQGKPYMMQPQVYSNRGSGRFSLLNPASVGAYFDSEHLGRSVALLDWDRDGRQDFAVLNLYEPSSLLTNRTQRTGHFLHLHLRGVRSERDAIGTTVHVRLGNRVLVRQLMAGDGFQCSNQRSLLIGLGDATQIDELQIQWPSGTGQKFTQVPVDREVICVEGSTQLVNFPRD